MRVLVVNSGSSTLKLRLLAEDDSVVASHDVDPWDGTADRSLLEPFNGVDAVGHRVVHGGESLREATRIDDDVLRRIEELTPLAPLHQPRAVAAIRALQAVLPQVPAVACFDTAFHASIPPAAATYALPQAWIRRWSLRRYGFHGLSHQYAVRRAAEILGKHVGDLRVVSCHLGAGASLAAVRNGRSVDTTMGFTPLEGLVMHTRSGSVDPGLVLWLVLEAGLEPADVLATLESSSGLAGLSGGSGDLRHVLDRVAAGDENAGLAFEVYVHRLRRELGAMTAVLGGLDVLVFTGGVGEHQPVVREAAAEALRPLGVLIDADRNPIVRSDGEIGAVDAAVSVVVVTAREDLEIGRQVRELLN